MLAGEDEIGRWPFRHHWRCPDSEDQGVAAESPVVTAALHTHGCTKHLQLGADGWHADAVQHLSDGLKSRVCFAEIAENHPSMLLLGVLPTCLRT